MMQAGRIEFGARPGSPSTMAPPKQVVRLGTVVSPLQRQKLKELLTERLADHLANKLGLVVWESDVTALETMIEAVITEALPGLQTYTLDTTTRCQPTR